MADITTRPAAGLPADFGANLMKGIADTRSAIVVSDGKPFFRLLRDGTYVFGASNEEMQEGSQWAVNLASLSRGWVCWVDGELLGQVMASVQAPRLPQPAPVGGHPFVEQFGFDMVCLNGSDKGALVQYKNNSYGFKKAFDSLISAIAEQYGRDPVFYWPVLTFDAESYDHKRYGQIWNPIFNVVAWADAEGRIAGKASKVAAPDPAPEPATEPAAVPAPKRQRKAPVAAADPAPEPEPAPVSTQRAHVAAPAPAPAGQRRRPAAR